MSIKNKYESIETIADWILKCLKGIKQGTHKVEYLESELYGCCEKKIDTHVDKTGNHSGKKNPNVFVVRLSESAYKKLQDKNELKKSKEPIKITVSELKKLGLHSEHIYPRKELSNVLQTMKSPTKEAIIDLINERCKVAYITKKEEELLDKKLTEETIKQFAKYTDKQKKDYDIIIGECLIDQMPSCWKENDDVDVRLTARGIELNPQKFLVSDI